MGGTFLGGRNGGCHEDAPATDVASNWRHLGDAEDAGSAGLADRTSGECGLDVTGLAGGAISHGRPLSD